MRFRLNLCLLALLCVPVCAQKSKDKAVDPTELSLESLLTMEVTTASKFPEKLSEAPGVMSVITQDELRRYGAMTLREALERVPGLVATSGYFGDRSMVAVRGDQVKENGSHILILINGRPVRETQEGGLISDVLQSFPVNILERIEVIRGPGSVLYGTNAFSGVINLITKKAIPGTSAAFRTGVVESGAGAASGELLVQRGQLNIVASAQVRVDPARRVAYRYDPTDPLLGPRDPLQFRAVPDQGPGAYLGVNYKGLHFMGAYTDWRSSYFVRGTSGENHWQRGFTNLGYKLSPMAKWDMSIDLTHTLTRLAASDFPSIGRASSDTVLEWTNVVRVSNRDRITFGALYNYVQGNEIYYGVTPAASISQGTRSMPGFYAQLEHRLADEWKVIGGLQANKIAKNSIDTVPRVGLLWNPMTRVHVKALYGKAFRAPSINEMRLNHPGLQGNPDLKPERIGTFDLNVSYQANRSLVAVGFYDSRQSAIILPGPTAGIPQYRNLGKISGRGMEFEGKQYLSDRLFAHGSLNYNSLSDSTIPTPRWTVAAGAGYQDKRTFTFSIYDVYQTSVSGGRNSLNPAPEPGHTIHAHSRFELSRLFGEWAKPLGLFAHGNNLANRQMWLPAWGSTTTETLPFGRGRTIYYGLEVALFRE